MNHGAVCWCWRVKHCVFVAGVPPMGGGAGARGGVSWGAGALGAGAGAVGVSFAGSLDRSPAAFRVTFQAWAVTIGFRGVVAA